MKPSYVFNFFLVLTALLTSCNGLIHLGDGINNVKASDVVITEDRPLSGFTRIDVRTVGSVVLSQGASESVTVSGPDNIVPLIKTSVSNHTLIIESDPNLSITNLNSINMLTFTIVVRELNSLVVSGLADISMDGLTTSELAVTMSGAGNLTLDQLTADDLRIEVSGLGNIEAAGEVTTANINISGAGGVHAPDLKITTAEVSIPGLGGATLWVTDRLTGTISGSGNVSYYGEPQASTSATGLGSFKALGNK